MRCRTAEILPPFQCGGPNAEACPVDSHDDLVVNARLSHSRRISARVILDLIRTHEILKSAFRVAKERLRAFLHREPPNSALRLHPWRILGIVFSSHCGVYCDPRNFSSRRTNSGGKVFQLIWADLKRTQVPFLARNEDLELEPCVAETRWLFSAPSPVDECATFEKTGDHWYCMKRNSSFCEQGMRCMKRPCRPLHYNIFRFSDLC